MDGESVVKALLHHRTRRANLFGFVTVLMPAVFLYKEHFDGVALAGRKF
jgi:hypothetical protein